MIAETESTMWDMPGAECLWVDVGEIREAVGRFLNGGMSEDAFRHFRVMRGIYSQRQPGVHMVRIRVPLGHLTAPQLRRLSELCETYGSGKVHVTTRQDVQMYFVPTADVPSVVAGLAEVGLTTRESGGSATRNVTVCSLAGVCPNQNLDVIPLAEQVGRHFLRHPLVQDLPRKFKIAFSGCERDCAMAGVNDTGFIANPDGKGFRMLVAGGLGATPQAAVLLDENLPYGEVLPMAEAVVRAFDRLGDRTDRKKARLKHVARRLGANVLAREIAMERALLNSEIPRTEDAVTEDSALAPRPAEESVSGPPGVSYAVWRWHAVLEQRQTGFYAVRVFTPRGDLSAWQLLTLADAMEQFSSGTIRTTVGQGVILLWVPEENLPAVYRYFASAGLAEPYAGSIADVVTCPAAATCRLGVTRATDAGDTLSEILKPLALDEDLQFASVKVSGCPNSCGHHHLATIGLHGAAATVNGRKVPCYQILIGGGAADGVAFARPLVKVPARRIRAAVLCLIALCRQYRADDETLTAFFRRVDLAWLRNEIIDLTDMAPWPGEGEDFFTDIGDTEPFRITTADSECSA